ncbi:hypothetical protein [Rhodococcus ruber]|uniref:hypothetical protein n=1 Tax=Rhodococcus ruber TaxID=1830 RepID=UPI00111EB675|nr:hypothetical protein [Rhodococcus ruber]QDC17405.1 hypothetical protein E2561_24845 [Rhodococcus ruber]
MGEQPEREKRPRRERTTWILDPDSGYTFTVGADGVTVHSPTGQIWPVPADATVMWSNRSPTLYVRTEHRPDFGVWIRMY